MIVEGGRGPTVGIHGVVIGPPEESRIKNNRQRRNPPSRLARRGPEGPAVRERVWAFLSRSAVLALATEPAGVHNTNGACMPPRRSFEPCHWKRMLAHYRTLASAPSEQRPADLGPPKKAPRGPMTSICLPTTLLLWPSRAPAGCSGIGSPALISPQPAPYCVNATISASRMRTDILTVTIARAP